MFTIPVLVTQGQRVRNAAAMMEAFGAPMTRTNLTRLAKQYEAAYRRARVSKRVPEHHLLVGMLGTARAYWTLARRAVA